MACECDNLVQSLELPEYCCVLADNYSISYPTYRYGFGKKIEVIPASISCTLHISGKAENELFWEWYRTSLEDGSKEFTVNLPFLGRDNQSLICSFADPLKADYQTTRVYEYAVKLLVKNMNEQLDDTFDCEQCN
jgi:hypothetical protein